MNQKNWELFENLYEELAGLPKSGREAFLQGLNVDEEVLELLRSSLAENEHSEHFFDSLRGVADEILHDKLMETERPPDRIGAYRIATKIGRGGFSSVYLATRDNDFSHRIAVKILHKGLEGGTALNRFYAERRILASLSHPNIATLYDGGVTDDGRPYLFMEYVNGIHVDQYCSLNNLALPDRLKLFLDICEAIGFAHRNLVIHRDIKPSNILVNEDGRVKLLDFGIAKLIEAPESEAELFETRAGTRVFTPMYSSPEQIRGEAITTASDVYQLGILLYRMLTGGYPFIHDNPANRYDLEQAILNRDPVPPSRAELQEGFVDPAMLRGDLDQIILMALNRDPARRYGTVAEFADDIHRYIDGQPVRAVKPSYGYRARRFLKRHKAWAIPTVAAVLLMAVSLVGLLYQSQIIRSERDIALRLEQEARTEADKAERLAEYLIDLFRINDPVRGGSPDITARQLLERGTDTLDEQLGDQPATVALFAETLGRIYTNMGMFDNSRALLEKAVGIREELDDPVDLARARYYLGSLHSVRRDFNNAIASYRHGLQLLDPLPERDVTLYVNMLTGYATSLRDTGQPDSAAFHMGRAYTLASQFYEPSDSRLYSLKGQLGYIYRGLGRYDEAETLYREVILALTEPEIRDTLGVISSLNNLGYLLRLTERYEESVDIYTRSLELHDAMYGDTHPRSVMINNNRATATYFTGDYERAEQYFLESVERTRNGQLPGHWRIGSIHNTLARFYHDTGNFKGADSLYAIILPIYVNALGEDHEWTTSSLTEWAATLAELDRKDEVMPMLAQVIRLTGARYGAEHENIARARDLMTELGLDAPSEIGANSAGLGSGQDPD